MKGMIARAREALRTVRATIADEADFDGWRRQARALALAGVVPGDVAWTVGGRDDLLADEPAPSPGRPAALSVPRAFLELAEDAALHRDPGRHALLYRLLWRLRADPGLLEAAGDPDVARVAALARAVRRDRQKMKAFLRFREINAPDGTRYLAWFEPDHFIVESTLPFFAARFASLRWAILTPYRSGLWDGATLRLGPGAPRADVPAEDASDEVWRAFFVGAVDPARFRPAPAAPARNLQAPRSIPSPRSEEMAATTRARAASDAPPGGDAPTLDALREAAAGCRNCPLWRDATQLVFGEGAAQARIMFVGEQPGDREDLAGRPFVGPAGKLLDRALEEAGIARTRCYVTNAVKHFKFLQRGKLRLHQKPNASEIKACRPWLARELELVDPAVVVALGATAAQGLLGRPATIARERGRVGALADGRRLVVTVHPSYLLRIQVEADKNTEYKRFVADLARAAAAAR